MIVNNSSLQNIASAIRYKNRQQTTYLPSEMDDAILALESLEYLTPLYFEAKSDNTNVTLVPGTSMTVNLQISTDGLHWSNWVINQYGVFEQTINNEDKLYIRGENQSMASSSSYCYFNVQQGSASIGGNIMSLLSHDFKDMTSLEGKNYCFYGIFSGLNMISAKSLILPALTLSSYCYANMFFGNTFLIEPPNLPAETLATYCYQNMFNNCTSLKMPPALNAKTLTTGCYSNMFAYCSSLIALPELPATTLAQYCYQGMFQGCTGLTEAPELPAATTVTGCYTNMFKNCSNLCNIEVYAESWNTSNVSGWVSGVAATGTFRNKNNITIPSGVNGIPTGWTVVDSSKLMFASIKDGSTIGLFVPNNIKTSYITSIQTSTNGTTWSDWSYSSQTQMFGPVSINAGSVLYIRGIATAFAQQDDIEYSLFKITGKIKAYGNIMNLLCTTGYQITNTISNSYAFWRLFQYCDGLISAPDLPATGLSQYCYGHMFNTCTNLRTAPVLPATEVPSNGYTYMFQNCRNLKNVPDLPAKIISSYAYSYMFSKCRSLVTPPKILATSIDGYACQYMFEDCYNLKSAPDLLSKTIGSASYQHMFRNCINLETAPYCLPAETLQTSCYQNMFLGCISLKVAPILPAKTSVNGCYGSMFQGCVNLIECADVQNMTSVSNSGYTNMYNGCNKLNNLITPNISSWNTSYFNNWANGIAATGIMYKPDNLTVTTGTSGIPSGWTTATHTKKVKLSSKGENEIGFSYKINGTTYTLGNNSEIEVTMTRPETIEIICANAVIKINDTSKFISNNSYILSYDDYYVSISCYPLSLISSILCFTANTAGSTISMTHNGTNQSTTKPVIFISTDNKATWSAWDYTTITLANTNSKVYMLGFNASLSYSSSNYSRFTMTGSVAASGDLTLCEDMTTAKSYCFYTLFQNCTSLTSAPDLPAENIGTYCYYSMFQSCTNLITAPSALPSVRTASSCYYSMFYDCSNLTSAPEIFSSPGWNACFYYMFRNCRQLNYIKVHSTSWNTNVTVSWVSNVASSGTFVKPADTTIPSGTSGIPSGWTVQTF